MMIAKNLFLVQFSSKKIRIKIPKQSLVYTQR